MVNAVISIGQLISLWSFLQLPQYLGVSTFYIFTAVNKYFDSFQACGVSDYRVSLFITAFVNSALPMVSVSLNVDDYQIDTGNNDLCT